MLSPYHDEDLDDTPILYPLHYGVAVTEATYAGDNIPDHIVQRRMHVQKLHELSGGYVFTSMFSSLILTHCLNIEVRIEMLCSFSWAEGEGSIFGGLWGYFLWGVFWGEGG